MPREFAVGVVGLKDFRRELRRVDEKAPKQLKATNKNVAKHVQAAGRKNAKVAAGYHGALMAKSAMAITGYAEQTYSSIGINNKRRPYANPAFWGAKARTGWFAQEKYAGHRSQHPEWVGNSWDAASRTEGPYVLNYTLAEEAPEIIDIHAKGMLELFEQAFPNK
jgi:hypothetical protein